ncbi:MAG: methyltransferase domain-containing protein [Anaerolineales bacterium]|nr:methyltransferase domain-containing protein [Anaerolineales bacterium]
MRRTKAGDLVMLITGDKKFIFRLEKDNELQTHKGVFYHNDLIGSPWGSMVPSHLGTEFLLFEPTLRDVLLHIERKSQIVFPKDIGYILLRLSIGPGKTVLEAGTGSGALTTALAWAVGPSGTVLSYDRRKDMQELAKQNLKQVGLEDRVDFRIRDLSEGFDETDVDALFLDLPYPQKYLVHVRNALSNGGTFGAILPTTNQVADLLRGLHSHQFGSIDVCEILLRFYKIVPERIRPLDRMVAHTGYLVFARSLLSDEKMPSVDEEDFAIS